MTTETAETAKETSKPDNAAATANADTSAAAEAGKGKIPPKPTKAAAKKEPAKAKTDRQAKAGANNDFAEPGSTLNPADPAAPNYRFDAAGEGQARDDIRSDQSVDQGTGIQPPSPMLAGIPAGGGKQDAENGDQWSDETGPRGRVISVTRGQKGAPSTTYEDVLPAGATDADVAKAKERLQRRFLQG